MAEPEVLEITAYCLGTMDPKCDQCQKQANWLNMENLPQEMRLKFQKNMTSINTSCIDLGYPHFEELVRGSNANKS